MSGVAQAVAGCEVRSATMMRKRGCGVSPCPASRRQHVLRRKSTEFMLAGFHFSSWLYVPGTYRSCARHAHA